MFFLTFHSSGEINRVLLQQSIYENDGSTDYINATYVNVSVVSIFKSLFFNLLASFGYCLAHNEAPFFLTSSVTE